VRVHGGGSVARIELPTAELDSAHHRRAELAAAVHGAGFDFCALDLDGFASGRMNVLLGMPAIPA
jgi:pyridinium-3,5-biscarboxylic acid mononucleotide sulfurtransferase